MKNQVIKGLCAWVLLTAGIVAEPVTLHFDWQPGLQINVASATQGNTTMQSEYLLDVDTLGEGLSVAVKNFNLSDSQLPRVPNMNLPIDSLERMARAPSIKVTTDGAFVNVTDAETRVEEVRESLRSVVSGEGLNIPPQLEALVGTALSEVAMDSAAGNSWNSLVGFWVGKELEPGAWAQGVYTSTVPMFPNTDLEMDVKYRMASESPCSEGYEGTGCVKLERISTPKEGSLKALMKVFLAEAMGGADITLDSIKEITVENKSTLITDPQTLRPQRLEIETAFRITMQMGGMTLPVVEQIDKQTLRYTYPK